MKLIIAFLLLFVVSAQAAECLTYSSEVTLQGLLIRSTFPEQPNYESIAKGDAKATYFFVSPREPFCVKEGNNSEGSEPAEPEVKQVQLVFFRHAAKAYRSLRPFLGNEVICSGSLYPADNGHHHSPVLLWDAMCRPFHHSSIPSRKRRADRQAQTTTPQTKSIRQP